MPFPATLTLVTVSGAFDVPPSGGATGTVQFIADRPLQGSTIVPPFERTAVLAADGTFTIQLPATNDPQWAPSGWAYRVVATVAGAVFSGTLQLDHQATSVTLAALLQPNGAAVTGTTYLLLSQRGVAGGVAGLDADGDVIDADGDKVGGGGGAPSATVVSETAYGQSATAGAATTFARGDHTHGTPAAPVAATITDSTTTGRAVLTAPNAAAARTALGLGGSATLDVGTTAGTVAPGNDARITGALQSSGGTVTGNLAVQGVLTASPGATIELGADTNLYRVSANKLGTDDALDVGGNLRVYGSAAIDAGATVQGDATVAGTGKAYRFKTSGASLDLDSAGTDLYLSAYPNADFTGTQRTYVRYEAGAQLAHLLGRQLIASGPFDSAGVADLDPATGVAALGAKNSLTNVRLCGFKATTGAPTTGTWATGDVVLDSAGRWYLCSAGGTPGTWTTPARSDVVVKGYVTSGNVTPQNTSGAWAALTGGPTFTIAAAIGDEIVFDWAALQQRNLTTFYDACVLVGGSPVRFASSGGATAAAEGDPGWYPDAPSCLGHAGPFALTAASGDISGGNVTIGFAVKSAGSGLLYASTSFPLRYRLVNSGPSA